MNFDKAASTYHTYATIQKASIGWALDHFHSDIENKSVIELGAGTGLLTECIAKKNPLSIQAVDISLGMLQEASKRLGTISTIQWVHSDAWCFSSEPVDYLFSSHLLQWASDPMQILKKWRLLIKKNGYIFLIFFIQDTLQELYEVLPESNFLSWKSHADWCRMLISSGFYILDTHFCLTQYYFNSPKGLLKLLQKSGVTRTHTVHPIALRKAIALYSSRYSSLDGVVSTWKYCYFLCSRL
jgi:malonyl-CoA O-methyltransferase